MVILSKGCKPDNFESYDALKLSFMNILGLHSNFDDCKSFLESNSADILALCETNQNDTIDSGNLSVRGYLPLIRNNSTTHMHGLSVYMKEGLPFAWDLSRENCSFFLMFLTGFTSLSVFLLFPLSITFFVFMHSFDSGSSDIDEVLSINPSTNVFVFGDFNVHHKDWLTYSGEIDGPGELCYNFSASDDLTQMVNFPTQIPDYDYHRPTLLNVFLFSDTSICSAIAFPPLGNSNLCCCLSFH